MNVELNETAVETDPKPDPVGDVRRWTWGASGLSLYEINRGTSGIPVPSSTTPEFPIPPNGSNQVFHKDRGFVHTRP